MINAVKDFCTLEEIEDRDREIILSALDLVLKTEGAKNALTEAREAYRNDKYTPFMPLLEKADIMARETNLSPYTCHLLLVICLTDIMADYYEKEGICPDIFKASAADIKYKLNECKKIKGTVGTFVAPWYGGFFNLTRFAIGRLQFECVKLPRDYKKGDIFIPKDTEVINVHIPGSGKPLSEGECTDSFRNAAEFFKNRYGTGPVFVCHSWLLFPEHEKMLPEGSNILKFKRRFDIVASGYDGGEDLWRIFDTEERDAKKLCAKTSLQRAYLDFLNSGGEAGWGRGIYIFEKGQTTADAE